MERILVLVSGDLVYILVLFNPLPLTSPSVASVPLYHQVVMDDVQWPFHL